MLQEIVLADKDLFYLIYNLSRNVFLDKIFLGISLFGSIFLWLAVVGVLWFKQKRKISILLLLGLVIDIIIVYALKFGVSRPRPLVQMNNSFPSGHASRAFLGTVVLADEFPKFKVPLYTLSILVMFSRIYTGTHYPIDAFFGAIIGILIGRIVLKYKERITKLISSFCSL